VQALGTVARRFLFASIHFFFDITHTPSCIIAALCVTQGVRQFTPHPILVEQLLRMQHEMLAAERRRGTEELRGTQTAIDHQVQGMREELARLNRLVEETERDRREHVGELSSQLHAAGRQTQVLAETTQSLREALSSTTARGQWGERMAEDVLRLAGFVDGVNYRRHRPLPGSGGIPDYTFLLPQGLTLHMDVKFPLNNYLRILDATSDVEREHARKGDREHGKHPEYGVPR